ncbi:MAG: NAD(P)H-binding protein [Campylobacteraceae bacterium]
MKAIVIGATGLVGSELLRHLSNDTRFREIITFSKREPLVKSGKITSYIIDFDKPKEWENLVVGDVLFSTLGTTIKQAKTKENQYKIDFTYNYEFAKIAQKNGVKSYVLVSSMGADAKSKFFYTRIKGELDNAVLKLDFKKIRILRPSGIVGVREKSRFGEEIMVRVIRFLNFFGILKSLKPIDAKILSLSMINSLKGDEKVKILTKDECF